MSECVWIQFEPAESSSPYPGFINGTVTGTEDNPPPLAPPRLQAAMPPGTIADGMKVDVDRGVLIPDDGAA
jgi:hypothetical protein